MKVKMLDSQCGNVWPGRAAVHLRKGEEHDVPDHVGARWLALGIAEPCAAPVLATGDKHEAKKAGSPRARARETEKGD